MAKPIKKKKLGLRRKKNQPEEIVIDRDQGLVFKTEKELFEFFDPQIQHLEAEYESFNSKDDFKDDEVGNLEEHLELTLDEPAEIWHDEKTFKDFPIFHFIRPVEELNAFHVAVAYISSDDEPTFIFFHFLSRDLQVVEKYRRGDLVYDQAFEEVGFGAIDGDSLSEGDPLSMGLFLAMLKVRSETDVPFEKFQEYGKQHREDTIENADEIWRSADMNGHNMVTFIKDLPDSDTPNLHYIAITLEDSSSQVHTLLYSFPTNDEGLVDRYRQGENLQADEVSQESSH